MEASIFRILEKSCFFIIAFWCLYEQDITSKGDFLAKDNPKMAQ